MLKKIMHNAEYLKTSIIHAIELLRQSPPDFITQSAVCYKDVLHDLDVVQKENRRGKSYCGMASDMVRAYLPKSLGNLGIDARVLIATAATKSGTFHHYNVVVTEHAPPVICDLTAAQFFTRPTDLFKKKPYFVGSYQELKNAVKIAAINTENLLKQKYEHQAFRDLWDIDLHCHLDSAFREDVCLELKNSPHPCLWTESFYHAWDITWGDTSRILRAEKDDLTSVFNNHACLTRIMTPALRGTINWESPKTLTRKNHP